MLSISSAQDVWDTLSIIDRALVEKNTAVLNDLLSEDFTGVIPTGAVFAKEPYIGHHCNSPFGLIELREEDISSAVIRLAGESVIVNRKVAAKLKLPPGNILSYEVQRTEILISKNGRWLLAGGHGTKLVKEPTADHGPQVRQ